MAAGIVGAGAGGEGALGAFAVFEGGGPSLASGGGGLGVRAFLLGGWLVARPLLTPPVMGSAGASAVEGPSAVLAVERWAVGGFGGFRRRHVGDRKPPKASSVERGGSAKGRQTRRAGGPSGDRP